MHVVLALTPYLNGMLRQINWRCDYSRLDAFGSGFSILSLKLVNNMISWLVGLRFLDILIWDLISSSIPDIAQEMKRSGDRRHCKWCLKCAFFSWHKKFLPAVRKANLDPRKCRGLSLAFRSFQFKHRLFDRCQVQAWPLSSLSGSGSNSGYIEHGRPEKTNVNEYKSLSFQDMPGTLDNYVRYSCLDDIKEIQIDCLSMN